MPRLNDTQAQQADEAEEFSLLDAGSYLGVLNSVEERDGDKGPYWVWEFALVEDTEGNELDRKVKLWENTSLSEKALFRVAAMFEAFEVPTNTDTDELLGQYVLVNVGQEVARQGARQGQLRNCFLSAAPLPE